MRTVPCAAVNSGTSAASEANEASSVSGFNSTMQVNSGVNMESSDPQTALSTAGNLTPLRDVVLESNNEFMKAARAPENVLSSNDVDSDSSYDSYFACVNSGGSSGKRKRSNSGSDGSFDSCDFEDKKMKAK